MIRRTASPASRSIRACITAALAVAAMLACAPGARASEFRVNIRNNAGGNVASDSGPLPVDTGGIAFNSTFETNAFLGRAGAGPGFVKARSLALTHGIPGLSNSVSGTSSASFNLDDVFITGPAGVPAVNASVNFHFSGILSAGGSSNGSADASVQINIQLPGQSDAGSALVRSTGLDSQSGGLLAGQTGPTIAASLTTGTATFSTTAPNTIAISLVASGESGFNGGSPGDFSEGQANFYDTLNFSTSGPVFNLPDGFTANSLSGQIINNQFVGLPEPALATLLTPLALGITRRRRRLG
jgi:hypothetical protein